MNLPKIDKPWILSELSKASVILAIASGIPYSFGEVADVLGPQAKKAVTLITIGTAALAKFTEWAIRIVTAYTGAPVPPVTPSPLSGPALQSNNPKP